MGAEEIEHRAVRRRLIYRGAQAVRGYTCNIEETLRAHGVREDPAERAKG